MAGWSDSRAAYFSYLAAAIVKGSRSDIMCMSPGFGATAGSFTMVSTTAMLSSSATTPQTVWSWFQLDAACRENE